MLKNRVLLLFLWASLWLVKTLAWGLLRPMCVLCGTTSSTGTITLDITRFDLPDVWLKRHNVNSSTDTATLSEELLLYFSGIAHDVVASKVRKLWVVGWGDKSLINRCPTFDQSAICVASLNDRLGKVIGLCLHFIILQWVNCVGYSPSTKP